tara:strand:- start:559 stop:822 length:264 start_codon:yes stop_codon:yes gene_type:complete
MQKPTITQIKQSGVLGEYFFSRDTLRFFGQTMSSFKTDWQDKDSGIVRLYAPMFIGGDNVGTTERFVKIKCDPATPYCYQVASKVTL